MGDEGNAPENTADHAPRDANGRWKPGHAPNPRGRPKVAGEVRALAQQHCAAAITTLVELMTTSPDERVRLSAAEAILDRGVGKPIAAVEVTHTDTSVADALENMRRSERGQHLLALAEAIASAHQSTGRS
jgi:HEAT repeat protein